MIHQTTVTRVRAFWGRTLYRVACTCAGFVAGAHQGGVL